MTINGGGSLGSNILTTHPKRKKQGHSSRKMPKVAFLQKEATEPTAQKSDRSDRVYRLRDLSENQRNAILSNLIDAQGHRIEEISSDDIATAIKSCPFVVGVPQKIKDENDLPILVVSLNDRVAKTIVTKDEVLEYLR